MASLLARTAAIFLLFFAFFTALFLGAGGYLDLQVCSQSCQAVHESSFGYVFGLPVGTFGAAAVAICLILSFFRKHKQALILMSVLVGADLYMVFVQVVHLKSVCYWCFAFFFFLVASYVLFIKSEKAKAKYLWAGISSFFVLHFMFFPVIMVGDVRIPVNASDNLLEIYASPGCSHCKQAISDLQNLCRVMRIAEFVRPVGLNAKDRELATKWVCDSIFSGASSINVRLAEALVISNEDQARKLAGSKTIQVPTIVLKSKTGERVFVGWTEQVKNELIASMRGQSLLNWNPIDDSNQATDGANVCTEGQKAACGT